MQVTSIFLDASAVLFILRNSEQGCLGFAWEISFHRKNMMKAKTYLIFNNYLCVQKQFTVSISTWHSCAVSVFQHIRHFCKSGDGDYPQTLLNWSCSWVKDGSLPRGLAAARFLPFFIPQLNQHSLTVSTSKRLSKSWVWCSVCKHLTAPPIYPTFPVSGNAVK